MSVEIRQLKDKHTGAAFVPVTHWDAVAGKPNNIDSGTSIDDTATASDSTWSSSKINTELGNKQGTLTSGTNINITNNVISALGYTYNTSTGSFAEGVNTTASGNASHAEGAKYDNNRNTESLGQASHAEGASTYAKADGSHAEGVLTTAGRLLTEVADAAQQLGITGTQVELVTKLAGYGSHAEGTNNNALGSGSHAEGNTTNALANATHAEGDTTTAFGEASHAEGYNTQAKGNLSHAEGQSTIADGNSSHVEGIGSTASGNYSHAEGSHTISYGRDSHAEGTYSEANGIASHVEGDHTVASNDAEHAEGTYNVSHLNTIHSIGIGTAANDRKNAVEVTNTGDVYIKGIGNYTGTTLKANDNNVKTLQDIIDSKVEINDSAASSSSTYSSSQINTLLGNIHSFDIVVVNNTTYPNFPTGYPASESKEHTIYLSSNSGTAPNTKDEYIYINNNWELIGNTSISVTDTKNTAGATGSTNKLYLIGAEERTANPQTYSHSLIYAKNGELHSRTLSVGDGLIDLSASQYPDGYAVAEGNSDSNGSFIISDGFGELEFIILSENSLGNLYQGLLVTESDLIGRYAKYGNTLFRIIDCEINDQDGLGDITLVTNKTFTITPNDQTVTVYKGGAFNTNTHVEGLGTVATNTNEHALGIGNVSHMGSGANGTVHSIGIATGLDSTRTNAVEVMKNGDVYVKGVGNYDGIHIKGETGAPSGLKTLLEAIALDNNTTYNISLNGTTNGDSTNGNSLGTLYAPTTAGTSDYVLKSNGSGAPSWSGDYARYLLIGNDTQADLNNFKDSGFYWFSNSTNPPLNNPSSLTSGGCIVIKSAYGYGRQIFIANNNTQFLRTWSTTNSVVTWSSWELIELTDTTYSVFGASGSNHSSGLVPDPGSTSGTSKYLCEDGTWKIVSTTDTKNTAGSTNDTGQLYLIGAKSQDNNPQTYSNSSVYTLSGSVYSSGFYQTSDERKKDIKSELDLNKCYDLIEKCSTVIYNWKDDENHKDEIGMIALEVKEFFPEIVHEDENGFMSLDYSKLTVICIRVLKDLIDKVKKL